MASAEEQAVMSEAMELMEVALILFIHYPLKALEIPETMAALVEVLERLLPAIKKIIERVDDENLKNIKP